MPPDRRRNALDQARIEATMPGEKDIRLYDGDINPSDIKKAERTLERDEEARRLHGMRFSMESDGTLAIRLGRREVTLTPGETTELRRFLDATRTVAQGAESC